jgi:acyl carrier protein
MTDAVLERVRLIAAQTFGLTLDRITPASTPDTVKEWDSLQHVNLIVALEQAFKLQFTPEELEQTVSIKQIERLIEEKLARTSRGRGV